MTCVNGVRGKSGAKVSTACWSILAAVRWCLFTCRASWQGSYATRVGTTLVAQEELFVEFLQEHFQALVVVWRIRRGHGPYSSARGCHSVSLSNKDSLRRTAIGGRNATPCLQRSGPRLPT